MNTHTFSAVAGLLLAGGLLVACGGDDDPAAEVASIGTDTAATTPDDSTGDAGDGADVDPEEAMLEFTECMRDHGVDMPDPQTDGSNRGAIMIEGKLDDEDFQAAQEACEPIMEAAMGEMEIDPEREAEMREQLLAFSECMREHGIDMPDPVFQEGGGVRVEMAAPAGGASPGDDEEFQAAAEECNQGEGGLLMGGPEVVSGAVGEDGDE